MLEYAKVYVGMPSGNGFPYPDTIINIYNQTCVRSREVDLYFYNDCIIKRKPIQHARNEIVHNFLKSGCTHLWFVDDDNPPALDVLEKLLSHGKDYISALVPIRHGDKYLLNVFKDKKHLTSYEGMPQLIEIDNGGTGCVLMTRELVKAMYDRFQGNPYQFRIEEFVCKIGGEPEVYMNQDGHVPKWNELYMLNNKGEINKVSESISEDLFFGREVQKLGYKLYADVTAHCTHYGFTNLLKVKYEETLDNLPHDTSNG